MPAPASIIELVERFASQRSAYKSGKYNETQLRRDFLDPFFEALGWDMTNRQGYSESYREVVHEPSVEVEGQSRAADYAFRVGDRNLFFVEAKKPAVNIETNPEPAFQLKRYGWSAKLSISILTDFEGFAVYDCTKKPKHGESPSIGRVLFYSYQEYISRWDEIYSRFSRKAVYSGAFDQFVAGNSSKRGTTDVDDAFLEEMERWREVLAHNIALRNPGLSSRELNTAVQTTIDRLIFLRICEDRGIEPQDSLRNATDGKEVYADLVELFKRADKRYNSGLFHFNLEKGQSSQPDSLTLNLKIDDKVLKDILANLYYPLSPYAFNYIPVDILGQVYERFLGKVIRLTPGHQAKVEEKPEVRKAGGVYYTPTYIVEYIVRHTVGELLKDHTPETLKNQPLRVLDPACGSGSFLLGAYQYLLDWYLDWYVQNDPGRWAKGKNPVVFESLDGWQLTMDKKKEILLSHIYGVDIDAQAVEVTKLSLLLKVVERPGQLSLLQERILPDLGRNIQCGNSLIGPDYFSGEQLGIFDTEEQYRVNPFDWQRAFPQVFAAGGFDAVIGNPPYYSAVTIEASIQKYFVKKYQKLWASRNDISYYFLLDAIKLCKRNVSFIMPRYYLNSYYANNLREYLAQKGKIEIVDTENFQCFHGVNILTTIIKLSIGDENGIIYHFADTNNDRINIFKTIAVREEQISPANWNFNDNNSLLERLVSHNKKLSDFFLVAKGMSTGLNEAFEVKDEAQASFKDRRFLYYLIKNGDIRRYVILNKGERFVIYLENQESLDGIVEYNKHLSRFSTDLKSRRSASGKWFHYSTARNKELWERDGLKIVVPFMATENRFAIEDRKVMSTSGDVSALIPNFDLSTYKLMYFLGILNSKLLDFYHRNTTKLKRGGYMEFVTKQLIALPIRAIDFSNTVDVKRHDRMVALVERMLSLHKQMAAARLPQEKELLERQIQATDDQIDRLVYDLYNLTEDEIRIVEGK